MFLIYKDYNKQKGVKNSFSCGQEDSTIYRLIDYPDPPCLFIHMENFGQVLGQISGQVNSV
jgi:hypothetical protein